MVFIFPNRFGVFEKREKPSTSQLGLSSFYKKCATASRADKGVDLRDQFFR